jgi:hypothetical protein
MREIERLGLHTAIERLPERARHVLIRRYSLEDRRKATLAELSRELGSPGNGSGRCRRRPKRSSKPESTPACSDKPQPDPRTLPPNSGRAGKTMRRTTVNTLLAVVPPR